MKIIADLHIHSHVSRATSRQLTLPHLHKWAQLKGVQVVGTGDVTHPGWLEEMQAALIPAEDGLFRLNDDDAAAVRPEVFPACQRPVRFLLSGEISTIYKKHDKTRKVHHVVFFPTFEAVERFQHTLEKIGNIRSDGRPILGLDSHDLLEIVLETDPQAHLIPAHIWTPWFAVFGSKSGFDTMEACFEELTPHIFAVETGLSSDSPMNWRLSALDRYTLVSNSDAHSPQKLAREANLFDTELSYPALFEALKNGRSDTFLGTIEFFPQEGKYHYDGHRKCQICWDPQTTLQHNGICPVCGKPVTVGVMHRIASLADRPAGEKPNAANPFHSLIPLPEILAEGYGVGANTKRVTHGYTTLLTQLGAELAILQDIPLDEIERVGGEFLAEGIRRMRAGEVHADPGYDGEYGVIRLFEPQERKALTAQMGFFPATARPPRPKRKRSAKSSQTPQIAERPEVAYNAERPAGLRPIHDAMPEDDTSIIARLNPQQREAVYCTDASLLIIAGPGTGKTRTLTHRIAYLIAEQHVPPEHLLALTFTNKAAQEMAERLALLVGADVANRITINTFHALCAMILRADGERIGVAPEFAICSEQERRAVFKRANPTLTEKEVTRLLDRISGAKNHLLAPEADDLAAEPELAARYRAYQTALRDQQLVDFDDLVALSVKLFETSPDVLPAYHERFRWIAVDEYQDLNLAQYRLLKLLKTPEVNLCVIGDPDQAIYGFRGANRDYFLRFQTDFPEARSLSLRQNYRSTQTILSAAQQVIRQSPTSAALDVWSDFVSQTKLDIYEAPTYKAEAEYVVHEIERMVGGTTYFSLDSGRVESHEEAERSFGDFAVLYRLGAQSRALDKAFLRSGIPYQIVGQKSLYDYQDMQEILAALWLLHNPDSRFHRDLLRQRMGDLPLAWQTLRTAAEPQPVTALIEQIHAMLPQRVADDRHAARLARLLAQAESFDTRLRDFLETTALRKETDDYDPRADRVTLMTLHAAKGLEFPVVFVVGCEETVLPYQREGQAQTGDLDEERRLFYVGMTRAQEKLVLTHARKRFLFGQTAQNPRSRFLDDIEQALTELKQRKARKAKPAKADSPQLSLF